MHEVSLKLLSSAIKWENITLEVSLMQSIRQKSKLRKVVIPFIEAEMLMHIFHAMEQRCGHWNAKLREFGITANVSRDEF